MIFVRHFAHFPPEKTSYNHLAKHVAVRMESFARVLVVDDDPDYCLLIQSFLEKRDYAVSSLSEYKELANRLQTFRPDAVLLDLNLGEESGINLLPFIRSLAPDAGIIMMSASKSPDLVFHALFEGASDFLEKPLLPPEVDLRIRDILKKRDFRNGIREATAALEKDKRMLLRYFSRETAEEILSGRLNADMKGSHVDISIMFFSIKNAGVLLKTMDPAAFAAFLNQAIADVIDLVSANHGSVNKLNGAGLLATFGLPVPSATDSLNAISCARNIRDHFQVANDAGIYESGSLEIGLGIASGLVFAGNIGSVRRMEYTVIGDTANLASRLDALCGESKGDILCDRRTVERSGLKDVTRIADRTIRGRKGEVVIYRV